MSSKAPNPAPKGPKPPASPAPPPPKGQGCPCSVCGRTRPGKTPYITR